MLSSSPSSRTLTELAAEFANTHVWRASEFVSASLQVVDTAYAALNVVLTDNGWLLALLNGPEVQALPEGEMVAACGIVT